MSKLNDIDANLASYESLEMSSSIRVGYLQNCLERTRQDLELMTYRYLSEYEYSKGLEETVSLYEQYQERLNTAAAHITGLPDLLEIWQTRPPEEYPAGYSFYLELHSVLSDHVHKRHSLQLLQGNK